MAGEISLSKPFLKETNTNSLFCLRSEVLSNSRDLSVFSNLPRVGARAGITTGATLSGPSLVSWFLESMLG